MVWAFNALKRREDLDVSMARGDRGAPYARSTAYRSGRFLPNFAGHRRGLCPAMWRHMCHTMRCRIAPIKRKSAPIGFGRRGRFHRFWSRDRVYVNQVMATPADAMAVSDPKPFDGRGRKVSV
jgi:hypothetical protein